MKKKSFVSFNAIFLLFLLGNAFVESYDEWSFKHTDFKSAELWMKKNWSYDKYGYKYFLSIIRSGKAVEVMFPSETFKEKKGLCFGSSAFAKHSLNKINPNHKAEIILLYAPKTEAGGHFVVGFYLNNNLWVMDYPIHFDKLTRGT